MTAPQVFRNGLPRMGALSSVPVSITTKSAGAYKEPTQTRRFFNISFGKPGHDVDTVAKVAECFWEVHHADGDRDDGASWIVFLDRQKISNYFHELLQ